MSADFRRIRWYNFCLGKNQFFLGWPTLLQSSLGCPRLSQPPLLTNIGEIYLWIGKGCLLITSVTRTRIDVVVVCIADKRAVAIIKQTFGTSAWLTVMPRYRVCSFLSFIILFEKFLLFLNFIICHLNLLGNLCLKLIHIWSGSLSDSIAST
jgi:hypothetical protein